MHELLALAKALGVRVHVAHLPPPYRGYYDAEEKAVVYDFALPPRERRYVLAHELGHAFFDHRCRDDAAAEAAADRYAARVLVDPQAYARAASANPDPHAIADELDVPVEMVRRWEETALRRLGSATYVTVTGRTAKRLG